MKKIISLLLVICMLAACCTAFAAEMTIEQKADALYLLGIFKGTDKGYELDDSTTREQGVTMLVRVLGKETEANSGKYACKFDDVYDWAKGYVGFAFENGITKGISDKAFGYGNKISDAMFLTMLLRIMGYVEGTDAAADFVWDAPYAVAKKAGLIASEEADAAFVRGDMVEIIYNALSATYKDSDKTVASQLIADGVFTAAAFEQAQKVAAGTTTLADAQAALNGGSGATGGGIVLPTPGIGGTPGGNAGGGTGGGNAGGGIDGTVENTVQDNHETPDIKF